MSISVNINYVCVVRRAWVCVILPYTELKHEYFTTLLNVALNTEGFTFNCWILFISVGVFVNILLGCGNMPIGFF